MLTYFLIVSAYFDVPSDEFLPGGVEKFFSYCLSFLIRVVLKNEVHISLFYFYLFNSIYSSSTEDLT